MIKRRGESGQALVLVLLSLSVVLTLVLFVLSRSVTDIATSSRDEEAVRAFSAAEAGVEQALVIGSNTGSTNLTDSSYNATVSNYAEGSARFNYPLSMSSGDSASLWFVGHDSAGNKVCTATKPCFTGRFVKVCWGQSGTSATSSTTPAIEAIVFYTSTPGDYTTTKVIRAPVDPYLGRVTSNSFFSAFTNGCSIDGKQYQFYSTLDLSALGIPAASYNTQGGLVMAKIRFLYNSDVKHNFGVDGVGGVLPSQGIMINSIGTSGESNRRLNVFQGWPEPPAVLDFAVFSSSGLSK